jgi:hypothetical protein
MRSRPCDNESVRLNDVLQPGAPVEATDPHGPALPGNVPLVAPAAITDLCVTVLPDDVLLPVVPSVITDPCGPASTA